MKISVHLTFLTFCMSWEFKRKVIFLVNNQKQNIILPNSRLILAYNIYN